MNTGRIISFIQDEQAEEILLPDGQIVDQEKAVVVLVIGESARKANFQLYGYPRATNPLLTTKITMFFYEESIQFSLLKFASSSIFRPHYLRALKM